MSTETDVRTHLDGKLQEFHLADSVARNFGDEASKRTTGLPTSKLADFRKNHAKPFDSAAEAALLEWCDKHCPKEKKNNKKVLALVGGVVAGMIALIGGVALATGGEETTEIAIGDPPGDVPVEEDIEPPATEVPAATAVPTAIPTATTVPTPVPVMPVGTIGTGCGITFHSPPPGFPNSFSYVIVDGMLVAVQGVLPDGTLILDTPGADVPQIETPVVGGLFEGLMPISSMTNYEVSIVGFTSTLGEPVDIVAGPILIDVGPAEGPIGGCTPASELTDDERDAIAEDHLITPAVDPDADPTPDPAATPGSGAQPGPVIIVDDDDGAIPAPKDDLAPYREFLTRFDTAHREGNAEVLFDWLDPLTIDIYGAEQCAAYLEGVVGSIGDIRLLDGAPDSPWTFSDGPTSADVFGAWDLQVELSILGDPPTSTNMHLRDGPDGVTWFTDCGEPLP